MFLLIYIIFQVTYQFSHVQMWFTYQHELSVLFTHITRVICIIDTS